LALENYCKRGYLLSKKKRKDSNNATGSLKKKVLCQFTWSENRAPVASLNIPCSGIPLQLGSCAQQYRR